MSWKFEIYRALFVALGMFEVITNASFLCSKNGLKFASKQHSEIPKDATLKQLKMKVTIMLTFGLLFLIGGVSSYVLKSVNEVCYLLILSLFTLYALVETIYYRYWKTFGFFIISILFLIFFII